MENFKSVEKPGMISRELLSGEHYFESLLEQGYQAQLLSGAELDQIQLDCLALLAKHTERFNRGESSSIRIEKAQDLLASILFTIGVQLKTYPSPDQAVAAMQRDGVEILCIAGHKRVIRFLQQSRMRHASLILQLLPTENVFYADTIVDGIAGFFKLYDPEFAAQELHITADYPVYNKTERLLGVEFIRQYLEQLYYENLFCIHFSAEDIHHLLAGYYPDYPDLLLNLYEPVLAAALGCILAGVDANQLRLTSANQAFLGCMFAKKEALEIEQTLIIALAKLHRNFTFPSHLLAYLKQSLPQLARVIAYSGKADNLAQVFLVAKSTANSPYEQAASELP